MSFEDKLVKIAENEQKVYEAGQKSMVDESKIIEKTAIGTTTLTIDDVSELPHDVEVQLGGYNLFTTDKQRETYGTTTNNLSHNSFEASVAVGTTLSPKYVRYDFEVEPNTDMFVSCLWNSNNSENNTQGLAVFNATSGLAFLKWGNRIKGNLSNQKFECSFNTGEATKLAILFYVEVGTAYGTAPENYSATVSNIQLTEGKTELPYMPYDADFSGISLSVNGETFSSTATGLFQGIKSVSPDMTFTTDEGIKIEAKYHKSWGMQTEYDRFWDSFQDYGNRTDYQNGFAGVRWNKQTLKPKYDIKPTIGYRMLYKVQLNGDLVEHLENLGVTLDCSNTTDLQMAFASSTITRVGIVDARKCSNASQTFAWNYKIETIDEFIVHSNLGYLDTFANCQKLVNLKMSGEIGRAISFPHSSKLSKASITSIINALSSTTSGLTVTLSKTAVTSAFGSTTSDEWLNLIATKQNWTISLV